MSFVERKIDVQITLGTGDFGGGQGNSVTLSGYQAHCEITKGGAPSWDAAQIRIWGVSLSLMNQLTRLGKPLAYPRNNIVTVSAGDADSGMSQVFSGVIMTAYGDFDAQPEVNLFISAFSNGVVSAQPAKPISFPQPTPASTIASQIASQMGLSFINDGVDVTIPGAPYYAGSSLQQLKKLAEAGNFNYVTNGGSAGQSLEIWPKGSSRGAQGPLIQPPGLVGYPKFSDAGVMLTSIFQPGMGLGSAFTLQTSLQSAVGTWFVLHLAYELEVLNPHGDNPWFMHIEAQRASLAS